MPLNFDRSIFRLARVRAGGGLLTVLGVWLRMARWYTPLCDPTSHDGGSLRQGYEFGRPEIRHNILSDLCIFCTHLRWIYVRSG